MSIQEKQSQLVEEFSHLKTWEDRYKRIIEMGKDLEKLPEEFYDEKLKVKGCTSQVWLHASLDDNKNVVLQADSDAMIVKGLVSLLLKVYSGAKPDEILASPPHFMKELGLDSHLSPSRANGFASMVKQIMMYALALKQIS